MQNIKSILAKLEPLVPEVSPTEPPANEFLGSAYKLELIQEEELVVPPFEEVS